MKMYRFNSTMKGAFFITVAPSPEKALIKLTKYFKKHMTDQSHTIYERNTYTGYYNAWSVATVESLPLRYFLEEYDDVLVDKYSGL